MRIVICDDDPNVASTLARMIRKTEGFESTGITIYDKGRDVLRELTAHDPPTDAVFIDIVLDGEDGIETAKIIHRRFPRVKIVFITGHVELAPDIFEAAPSYLLAKPFLAEKLAAALRTVENSIEDDNRYAISFQTREGIRSIPFADIEYVESDRRKLRIYGDFETFECYAKLSDVEKDFPANFGRCHQSFLVNMNRISSIATDMIMMRSGASVPIAQRRKRTFRDTYVAYITNSPLFSPQDA